MQLFSCMSFNSIKFKKLSSATAVLLLQLHTIVGQDVVQKLEDRPCTWMIFSTGMHAICLKKAAISSQLSGSEVFCSAPALTFATLNMSQAISMHDQARPIQLSWRRVVCTAVNRSRSAWGSLPRSIWQICFQLLRKRSLFGDGHPYFISHRLHSYT